MVPPKRAVALILVLAATLGGSTVASAKGWARYTAPDKSFSISFPIAPKRSSAPDAYVMEASPSKHVSYIAQYRVLKSSMEDRSEAAFAAVVQSLDKDGNTLTSMPPVKIAGHPGKDVKVVLKTGVIVWDRIVLVDNRLYQLIVATDDTRMSSTKFWNSFRLKPNP